MKLTIIEKAKNFDEALSRAKGFYERFPEQRNFLEKVFPELKESDDERIRKFLHHTFTALCKDKLGKWHGEPVVNILAWLEKQDEKNPAWMPSDEQLNSLYDVLNPCDGLNRNVLESLYVQLKKLREE